MPWFEDKKDGLTILPEGFDYPEGSEPTYPINEGDKKPLFLELGQFLTRDNQVYCFRPKCDGCRYQETCEFKETILMVGPGMNIRRAITPAPGYLLFAIDYSGIELRLAAEFSREPLWVKAFQEGKDLHSEMGCVMFKVAKPTKDQRKKAKVGNFNLLYLGGPGTIRQKTLCSIEEAQEICKSWWQSVPTYMEWTKRQWEYAKAHRGVHTAFMRFRNMEDLILRAEYEEKENIKGKKRGEHFARATATNSPIQGTCADLMKRAIVVVDDWIEQEGLREEVQILGTVHDELLGQARDDEHFEERVKHISELMCPSPELTGWVVPITTDIEVGYNWSEVSNINGFLAKRVNHRPLREGSLRDTLRVTCTWDLGREKNHLMRLLDEVMIGSEKIREEEVLVPLVVMTGETPGGWRPGFKASESVARQVFERLPGITIED